MKLPLFLFLLAAASAPAAVFSYTDGATTAIPDGDSSGVVRSLVASTGGQVISSVEVDLNLSAGASAVAFTGDLYVYLTNGSEAAVLMNRAGRRPGFSAGYSDNQTVVVTFSADAAADFHSYRVPVTGSETTPLSAGLTGSWQPDGRATDPSLVLTGDARTAGLNLFAGDAADGTWSLFAADLSTGATHQINSWTLRIVTVPEPGAAGLLLGTAALLAAAGRRR